MYMRLIVITIKTEAATVVAVGADLFLSLANKANYLYLYPHVP